MDNNKQSKYIRTLANLLLNENHELSKLINKRIVFYWLGIFMVVGAILASIKPIYPTWLITLVGIVGGYLLCIAIHLRQTLSLWPALKEYLNQKEIINAAKDKNA